MDISVNSEFCPNSKNHYLSCCNSQGPICMQKNKSSPRKKPADLLLKADGRAGPESRTPQLMALLTLDQVTWIPQTPHISLVMVMETFTSDQAAQDLSFQSMKSSKSKPVTPFLRTSQPQREATSTYACISGFLHKLKASYSHACDEGENLALRWKWTRRWFTVEGS